MNDTTTELPPPPPPPPPAGTRPDRPPLVRLRRGRMLAGVAAGLARHLRVDVTLVRIALVILTFTGGAGLLAYVAAWVLLPEEDEAATEPAVWTVQRGPSFWVGVTLLVVAAIVLVEHTTPFGSSFGTPVVLIAVGAALWKVSQDRAERAPSVAPVHTPAAPPADAPTADDPAATAPLAQPAWTPPPAPPWTPPPSRPRSALGRVTIALMLIALGGGALLDELDLVRFTALDAAATALLLTGVGLVVGAWFGRARGLLVLGILLVPVVVAASVLRHADIDLRGGAGERIHEVTAATGVEPVYSLGAGSLEIDLTDVDVPPGDTRSDIRMGAGEVLLLVPDDTSIVIDADVRLGALDLPAGEQVGTDLSERLVLGDPDAPGGTLHLDVAIGVGELIVRIVPTTEDHA